MAERHLRRRCRLKDAEVIQEKLGGEAGRRAVARTEQAVHGGGQVSLQAGEERDEVP